MTPLHDEKAAEALAAPRTRVLYLPEFTERTSNPCLVWRADWPTKHLPDHGIEAKIVGAMEHNVYRPTKEERLANPDRGSTELLSEEQLGKSHSQHVLDTLKDEVDAHDVLIFGRTDHQYMKDVIAYARSKGKLIGYETDDLTFGPNNIFKTRLPKDWDQAAIGRMTQGIDTQMIDADFVLVTTPTLFEQAAELRGSPENIHILKNRIDLDVVDDIMPEISHTKTKDIRIGYASGPYHADKLLKQKDLFLDIQREYGDDVTWVIKGFTTPDGQVSSNKDERQNVENLKRFLTEHHIKHELHPYTPTGNLRNYYQSMIDLKLDILLNPQDPDYYHMAKSELKYLEAAVIGAPIVTPIVGGCGHALANTRNGQLIDPDGRPETYARAIKHLIENPQFRQELATNARAHLLSEYDVKKSSKELSDIISRVRRPALDVQFFCLLNECDSLNGNIESFKDGLRQRLENMRDSSDCAFSSGQIKDHMDYILRHLNSVGESRYEESAIEAA